MDIKQLRVGNLLHYKEDTVTVSGINQGSCFIVRDKDLIILGIDNLKPIPLTEEWKRKLGFTAESIDPYFVKSYTKVPEHIKYVHQMQNLYYALTGEELQIK